MTDYKTTIRKATLTTLTTRQMNTTYKQRNSYEEELPPERTLN